MSFPDQIYPGVGENYGIVEDIHQSMMHCLAQYPRQSAMTPELVAQRVF